MIDKNAVIVGDADALVALYFKQDAFHNKVKNISKIFLEVEVEIVFPNTAIAEAIATLHRKLSNSTAADLLVQHYKKRLLEVEYVDENMMLEAANIYNPKGSKKNTFFDALVAACAKKLNAETIFSFDRWYKKLGFKLAADLE